MVVFIKALGCYKKKDCDKESVAKAYKVCSINSCKDIQEFCNCR